MNTSSCPSKEKGRDTERTFNRRKRVLSIVLTFGRVIDPKTGKSKPNQKWITVQGTKKQAEENE